MFVAAILIFVEFLIYNIIASPTESTDTGTITIILFALNLIITFIAILCSVNNDDDQEEAGTIKKIVLGSFVFRIVVLFWDVYARNIFILPNSEGDAEWYHSIGVSYAFGGRANEVDWNKYSFYIGRLYKLIGVQKLTAQFLNVFLAVWAIILIYRILCMLNIDKEVRKKALLFASFLPNLLMITTFFLQESVISFFMVLSLYCYAKWFTGKSSFFIILAILSSATGAVLHIGAIVVALGIFAMTFVVRGKERSIQLTVPRVAIVIIMLFVGVMILSAMGDTFLGKLRGGVSSENILYESSVRNDGGASYSIGIQGLPASIDIIVNTPIRMFYFLFSPLPWVWRGLSDILAFLFSTVFYIFAVYRLIKAYRLNPFRNLKGNNVTSFLLVLTLILLLGTVMFGWGTSNSGSVLRHREKFTYIIILLYAFSEEIRIRMCDFNAKTGKDK